MNKKFGIAVSLSAFVHIGIILAIVFIHRPKEEPFGDRGFIAVEVFGEGQQETDSRTHFKTPPPPNLLPQGEEEIVTQSVKGNGGGGGGGEAAIESNTGFGTAAGNPILTKIRMKIERAKYYPPIARRQGIEGKAEISFKINADGSLASAEIQKSSGNNLLDSAALDAIRHATPLPHYDKPITVGIKFSTDD